MQFREGCNFLSLLYWVKTGDDSTLRILVTEFISSLTASQNSCIVKLFSFIVPYHHNLSLSEVRSLLRVILEIPVWHVNSLVLTVKSEVVSVLHWAAWSYAPNTQVVANGLLPLTSVPTSTWPVHLFYCCYHHHNHHHHHNHMSVSLSLYYKLWNHLILDCVIFTKFWGGCTDFKDEWLAVAVLID